MGREIKFRAWNKVAKKFLKPWPDGFHILGETMCFDLIGMQLKERSPEKATLEMLNDVELEQYTGLKDRNGAEIYDGDILKTWMITKGKMGVYWEAAQVFWRTSGWKYGWPDGQGQDLWQWTRKDDITYECEKIGNIHQNPEMIDG